MSDAMPHWPSWTPVHWDKSVWVGEPPVPRCDVSKLPGCPNAAADSFKWPPTELL